ncbi:hypothetical protein [Paenibacillus sp. YN15]|uniref:hypothetical protein n=1 Tax=Paenibacillus sp. YN15 TaxID=1742774 RepID=UPI000DCD2041|nr:hypothetical protein [Paenibacillus sp. YN15]RAU94731.1 hypothetical protein DQG13_23435 [Paenibacillus sp. YN15]
MKDMSQFMEKIMGRMDQQEQMLTTLIQMQGATNRHIEELQQDMTVLKQEVSLSKADTAATKDLLHTFRSETNINFGKLERRIKLIEADLDATMVQVEQLHN